MVASVPVDFSSMNRNWFRPDSTKATLCIRQDPPTVTEPRAPLRWDGWDRQVGPVLYPYESGGSATQVGSGGYLKTEGNTRGMALRANLWQFRGSFFHDILGVSTRCDIWL